MGDAQAVEMWKTVALSVSAVTGMMTPIVIAVAGMIAVRRGERNAAALVTNQNVRATETAARVEAVRESLVSSEITRDQGLEDVQKAIQEQAKVTAARVEVVRATLEKTVAVREHVLDGVQQAIVAGSANTDGKLDQLAVVAHSTHSLVNGSMEIQLRLNKVVTRRLADMTKDPEDRRVADMAEELHTAHLAQMAEVARNAEVVRPAEAPRPAGVPSPHLYAPGGEHGATQAGG